MLILTDEASENLRQPFPLQLLNSVKGARAGQTASTLPEGVR